MARESRKRVIEVYITEEGRIPFKEWYDDIRDVQTRARIRRYVDRLENGNFGDHKGVGEGVTEMRLFFGPGYRIYFAERRNTIVVLLCGGDKSTQDADIKMAKACWKDYKKRKT